MELIKCIWNLVVLAVTITYFGGFATLTYKLGM